MPLSCRNRFRALSIDGIKPISRYSDGMVPRIREYFGTLEKLEKNKNEKEMSEEEVFTKLPNGTRILLLSWRITRALASQYRSL